MRQGALYRQEKSALKGNYWKKYHAILKDEQLSLFETNETSSSNTNSGNSSSSYSLGSMKAKHAINVENRPVAEGYENFSRRPFTFKIHQKDSSRDKFVFLACDSEDEMVGWINMLLVHGALRVDPVSVEELYSQDAYKHLQTEAWDVDALGAHRTVMKQQFQQSLHKDYQYVQSGVVFIMTNSDKETYKPYMGVFDNKCHLTFFTKKCQLSGLFLTSGCSLIMYESSNPKQFKDLIVEGDLPVFHNMIKYRFDVIVSASGERKGKIRLNCFVATKMEWEKWRDELKKDATSFEVCQVTKTRQSTLHNHARIMDNMFTNISEDYVKDTTKIALGRGSIVSDYVALSGLEVSVSTGMIVDILERRKDGLSLVRLMDRSQGLIPTECVNERSVQPKTTALDRFTQKKIGNKMPKRVNRSETIFKLKEVETTQKVESLTNVTHEKVEALRNSPTVHQRNQIYTDSVPSPSPPVPSTKPTLSNKMDQVASPPPTPPKRNNYSQESRRQPSWIDFQPTDIDIVEQTTPDDGQKEEIEQDEAPRPSPPSISPPQLPSQQAPPPPQRSLQPPLVSPKAETVTTLSPPLQQAPPPVPQRVAPLLQQQPVPPSMSPRQPSTPQMSPPQLTPQLPSRAPPVMSPPLPSSQPPAIPQKPQPPLTPPPQQSAVVVPPRPSTRNLSKPQTVAPAAQIDLSSRNRKSPLDTVKKAGLSHKGNRRLPSTRQSIMLLKQVENDHVRNSMQVVGLNIGTSHAAPQRPQQPRQISSPVSPQAQSSEARPPMIPLRTRPEQEEQQPVLPPRLRPTSPVVKPKSIPQAAPPANTELELAMKRRQEQMKREEEKVKELERKKQEEEKKLLEEQRLKEERKEKEQIEKQAELELVERERQVAREEEERVERERQLQEQLEKEQEEERIRREQEELNRKLEEKKQKIELEAQLLQARLEEEIRSAEEQTEVIDNPAPPVEESPLVQSVDDVEENSSITDNEDDQSENLTKIIQIFVQNSEGRKKAMSVPSQSTLFEISQQAKIKAVYGLPKDQISVFITQGDEKQETLIDTRICDIGPCTLLFDKVSEDDWL